MTLAQRLDEARRNLAGGWSEPHSLDAGGRMCGWADEGLVTYCVADALLAACAGNEAQALEATDALQAALYGQRVYESLSRWAEAQDAAGGRDEVLRLFARAAARARVEATTRHEAHP